MKSSKKWSWLPEQKACRQEERGSHVNSRDGRARVLLTLAKDFSWAGRWADVLVY